MEGCSFHVADNCCALFLVLEKGRPGATYHIGGGDPQPNIAVLRQLLELLGKPESLLTGVADRLGHDRRYAVDYSLIKSELGWQPKISFAEGLRMTIDWYVSNPEWMQHARSGEYQTYYEKIYGPQQAPAK